MNGYIPHLCRSLFALFATAFFTSSLHAQQVIQTFTIDPNRSTLGIFGNVDFGGTREIEEQAPGSLISRVSGAFNVSRSNYGNESIRFVGESIRSEVKQGPYLPGDTSADFAGKIPNLIPGIDAFAVIKNNPRLRISESFALVDSTGLFPLNSTEFSLPEGSFDYDIANVLSGSILLSNLSPPSPLPGSTGRFTRNEFEGVLELEFQAVGRLFGTLIPDINIGVEGSIIATTALAPEPVQWNTASGGNGNFYTVFTDPVDWGSAKELAEGLTYMGLPGRLVAIESIEENMFLTDTFGGDALHYKWIGGAQDEGAAEPDGGWNWINGEPLHLGVGSPAVLNNFFGPDDNENRLVFDGDVLSVGKSWNDLPGRFATTGYVVEFTAVPEASSLLLVGVGLIGVVAVSRRRVLG